MSTMPVLKKLRVDPSLDIEKLIRANRENNFPDLKAKPRAFAMNYVELLDHRAAAEAAKYDPNKGKKLLRDPLISAFIGFLQEKLVTRKLITREYIESQWLELNDIAMARVATLTGETCINADGVEVPEERLMHNLPVARAVLAEMTKGTNFSEDSSAQGGAVNISINLKALGVSNESAAKATIQKTILEGELG